MRNRGKVAVLVLIVLILISLSAAGGALYFLQKEREAKTALQGQLEELKITEKDTRVKLEDSRKIVASLEGSLRESKVQVEKLSKDLESEKLVKQQVLKEAYAQIDQMYAQLQEEKKTKAYLEKMFYETSDELSKMQAQAKDIESKRLALDKKVKELEGQQQKVELGKIVVSPENAAGTQGAATSTVVKPQSSAGSANIEGKVLVINKDYNFVVTNLGRKDGIEVGDTFSVFHSNNYIGDVKIEKIHDSMSAAGFISADTKDKVVEGDKVVQKAK